MHIWDVIIFRTREQIMTLEKLVESQVLEVHLFSYKLLT